MLSIGSDTTKETRQAAPTTLASFNENRLRQNILLKVSIETLGLKFLGESHRTERTPPRLKISELH